MTTRESIDTARLEALLEAATKGPWEARHRDELDWLSSSPIVDSDGHEPGSRIVHPGDEGNHLMASGWPNRKARANAELIVAAVNALPDLIAATKERGDLKERVAAHCEERDQALEDAADARARAEAAEAELAALRAGGSA